MEKKKTLKEFKFGGHRRAILFLGYILLVLLFLSSFSVKHFDCILFETLS